MRARNRAAQNTLTPVVADIDFGGDVWLCSAPELDSSP